MKPNEEREEKKNEEEINDNYYDCQENAVTRIKCFVIDLI